jgi:PAS domain S-box-containing protein
MDIPYRTGRSDDQRTSRYARGLIEASLDPLVIISVEGKITDVNEATVKVTGVPREKLVGTDFSDYFTEPQKARSGYLEVFETGFVTDYPLTIRHRDGRLTDVLYNASVYRGAAGNVLGVFAAARDVTLQKQASQYARSLVEASLDPLVTIDAEGKITDVNEAAVNVTGVPRRELIGTDFSDYFTEPQKARGACREVFEKGFVTDYPLTIRHKEGALLEEGASREERFMFLRPDGSTLPVEFRARAFELGGHKFVQAHVRDISERLRAEAQLQAQIDELRRFKNVTVDRELRMQELEERFARLAAQQATAG